MFLVIQGLNKVPFGSQGQVDFLAGQVKTFQAYLPNGQSVQRAAYPKDELKFKSFSSSPVLTQSTD